MGIFSKIGGFLKTPLGGLATGVASGPGPGPSGSP